VAFSGIGKPKGVLWTFASSLLSNNAGLAVRKLGQEAVY